MSVFDKAKDKAEQVIGEVKEKLGQATGNRDLENSGKADQVSGKTKEVGHTVRDNVAGAVHDAKERLDGDRR
ncbi:CsbD family protein [Actinokineospora inagensis]|uniref:CsbD family protein n=1 Tax=Actinokineospora inagensis TaxID=103730 RepID=UPI00041177B0|nr:CsbD family protein [Actinokineospora inagensis]